MTVQTLPWAIQGQTHPGEVARNAISAAFGAPVAALVAGVQLTTAGGAHGVVGSGDLVVAQRGAGANMSVDVAAGRTIIRSTEASSILGGTYSFLNDAVVNLVISAADPTNPRIDLVIAQVRDSNYSGAFTDARLTVVTGTPAASPAVPAVPNSCVVLAQIAVAALAPSITNANITDKRTRAYALGGTAVCTSATRPSGASLYTGLRIFETDTLKEWVYSGAAFVEFGGLGAWDVFTPGWISSGTQPVLGNGTIVASRRVIGKTCYLRMSLVSGTTTTYGTGSYAFTGLLPSISSAAQQQIIPALINAGALVQPGICRFGTSATQCQDIYASGSSSAVAALIPATFASGNFIYLEGAVELA